MAAIDEIVQVQISVEAATITKAGFGLALIAGYHNLWPEEVREFASLAELTDAGMSTDHAIYVAATKLFGQEFKPPTLKVGKLTAPSTDTYTLTPTETSENYTYSFDVAVGGGVKSPISFVNGAAESPATIATALQTQIDAVTGIAAADSVGFVTVTMTDATTLFNMSGWEHAGLDVQNTTADPGVVAGLAALQTFDPDWYGLVLASNSAAEVEAAASWAEANDKLFGASSSDADIPTGSASDLASALQLNLYHRTFLLYDADATMGHAAAALFGSRLPTVPGSSTWKFKRLGGVTTDAISGGERAILRGKSCNFYHSVKSAGVTEQGRLSSNRPIDVTRTVDWLKEEVQTNVFGRMVRMEKIPFTDFGADLVRSDILSALQTGINNGALASDPAPVVEIPKVATVSANDKANRTLPDVTFSAVLAGAIETVQIVGKLTV